MGVYHGAFVNIYGRNGDKWVKGEVKWSKWMIWMVEKDDILMTQQKLALHSYLTLQMFNLREDKYNRFYLCWILLQQAKITSTYNLWTCIYCIQLSLKNHSTCVFDSCR